MNGSSLVTPTLWPRQGPGSTGLWNRQAFWFWLRTTLRFAPAGATRGCGLSGGKSGHSGRLQRSSKVIKRVSHEAQRSCGLKSGGEQVTISEKQSYRRINRCRVSGSQNLVSVLNLGRQELTGVFPRSRE